MPEINKRNKWTWGIQGLSDTNDGDDDGEEKKGGEKGE